MRQKIENGVSYCKNGYRALDKLKIFLSLISGLIRKEVMPKLLFETTVKGDYIYTCQKGSRDYRKTEIYKDFIDITPNLDGKAVIDVGAHIGLISIPIARKYDCEVISIEGHPKNFELLTRNISANKLENVELHNVIASDEPGREVLHVSKEETGTGTHSIRYRPEVHSSEKIEIESKTVDEIYFAKDRPELGLIKIDVEGAEAEVLKGSKKVIEEFSPQIIFESQGGKHLESVKEILKPFGYSIRETKADYVAEK